MGQDAYATLAAKRGVRARRSKGEFSVADPVEIAKREAHRDAERVGNAKNRVRQGVRREDLNRLGDERVSDSLAAASELTGQQGRRPATAERRRERF